LYVSHNHPVNSSNIVLFPLYKHYTFRKTTNITACAPCTHQISW